MELTGQKYTNHLLDERSIPSVGKAIDEKCMKRKAGAQNSSEPSKEAENSSKN